MKARITQHLITTVLGLVILITGLVLLILLKINGVDFSAIAGVGVGLLLSKDDFLKRQ